MYRLLSSRILFLLILCTTQLSAQTFREGSNVLSAGIGLGGAFGLGAVSSQTPGISVNFEHGQWEVDGPGAVSIGGYLGFKSYSNHGTWGSGYYYDQKWSYTIIGIRSAYHYNGLKEEKLDVYGGLMLAYGLLNYSYDDNFPGNSLYDSRTYHNRPSLTLYLGSRYYFADNLAVFGELGYGVSNLTLGLSYNLK